MIHELKIKPEYFADVVSGYKTFEIRNNADRNFKVGDTLLLWEWDGGFTGQTAERTVSYITDFEQKPGYVVLGLANKREQELAEQLADATRQCGVMAGLLRDVTKTVSAIGVAIDDLPVVDAFLERIEEALAGKLPDQQDTEWTDAATSPVSADYRELQGQNDQLQSKYKAAMELLRETRPSVNYQMGMQRSDTGHREEFAGLLSRIDAMLSGQVPSPAVPEGLHLIYIGEIEVSHKWWINSKSDFFHPSENADFSDWPDGVNKLFRIAASPRQQGGEQCATEPPSSSPA